MPEEDEYFLILEVLTLAAKGGGERPAAALTEDASDREQERAIASGFETDIAKPIKPLHINSGCAGIDIIPWRAAGLTCLLKSKGIALSLQISYTI